MSEAFHVPPDMATLYHANRYLDANPGATYDDLMRWLYNSLHPRFPWMIVTPDVEARILNRLYAGKAIDA